VIAIIPPLVVANAVLAAGAGCAHIYGACHTSGWLRRLFTTIAALAFMYSASYWWLLSNPDKPQEWSNFLRPIGVVTWVVAWGIEPIILVHYLKRMGREMWRKAEKVVGEIEDGY
jgi:hypothetical protein